MHAKPSETTLLLDRIQRSEQWLLNLLWVQIPGHVFVVDLNVSKPVTHEFKSVSTSIFDVVVLPSGLVRHQAPMNQGARIVGDNLPVWLPLVVPRATATGPNTADNCFVSDP